VLALAGALDTLDLRSVSEPVSSWVNQISPLPKLLSARSWPRWLLLATLGALDRPLFPSQPGTDEKLFDSKERRTAGC